MAKLQYHSYQILYSIDISIKSILILLKIFDDNKTKIITDIKAHKLLNHQMALFRKTEEEEKHSLGQCCSCRLCTIIWLQVQLRVKLCFHISSSINKKTFFLPISVLLNNIEWKDNNIIIINEGSLLHLNFPLPYVYIKLDFMIIIRWIYQLKITW